MIPNEARRLLNVVPGRLRGRAVTAVHKEYVTGGYPKALAKAKAIHDAAVDAALLKRMRETR